MVNLVVGINKQGQMVYRNDSLANKHVFATGKSGSGKTICMGCMVGQIAEGLDTVVVINWRNTIDHATMLPNERKIYEKHARVIDVAKEGIKIPLFTLEQDNKGNVETTESLIHRVTGLLRVAGNLTPTQEGQVQQGLKVIYEHGLYQEEGIAALGDYLNKQERAVAKNAAAKIRSLCDNNVLRNGSFWVEKARIYEFDLNGLEYDDQLVVCRFLLDYFLRLANKGKFKENGLTILVDEVQNLDFGEGSTMYALVNESRRLNIRMLMATPTILSGKRKDMDVMLQCGLSIFFEPLDNERRKVANFIDQLDSDTWVFNLSRLKRGEFVAKGNFIINGKNVNRPLQLKTYIPEA